MEEDIEAAHGAGLANALIVTSLIATLREKGVLSRLEVEAVFDSALTGAEAATDMPDVSRQQARKLVEVIAQRLCGSAKGRRSAPS